VVKKRPGYIKNQAFPLLNEKSLNWNQAWMLRTNMPENRNRQSILNAECTDIGTGIR